MFKEEKTTLDTCNKPTHLDEAKQCVHIIVPIKVDSVICKLWQGGQS